MSSVDVLVIAALPLEYEAARAAASGWQEEDAYLIGELDAADGGRLTVALARPTEMGGRRTGAFAAALTEQLTPACLAMSGVCAGDPADTAPGDVVVASPAYEYDEGKLSGAVFQGAHQQYPLSDRWLRAVQDFRPSKLPSFGEAGSHESDVWLLERLYRGQNPKTHPARDRYFPRGTWTPRLSKLEADGLIAWSGSADYAHPARTDAGEPPVAGGWALTAAGRTRIMRALDDIDGPERLPFAVLPGPMASGSAVIQDPEIWARLKAMGARKILALEMEAATIATVAHDREVPHWLVAKGVMDHADFAKDDRFKHFAARASAEVLFALLAQLLPSRAGVAAAGPTLTSAAAGPTLTSAAAEPAFASAVTGSVKLDVTRRLHADWPDLADRLGIPGYERARFPHGREPAAVWEWLEVRGRLAELPPALDDIGRSDLSRLIRGRGSQ
ncbi:hypothetical protein AB0J83_38765 [Actinoplanes sp. NPDC049596]|uniref:phosphorylase family protein n=1 Tax=unclassified Actinoplanes TaxID=2626549 RepID=UPI00341A9CA4